MIDTAGFETRTQCVLQRITDGPIDRVRLTLQEWWWVSTRRDAVYKLALLKGLGCPKPDHDPTPDKRRRVVRPPAVHPGVEAADEADGGGGAASR